ncbi:hypothetical protein LTS18_012345, partial [Coniosporium uncinatum]
MGVGRRMKKQGPPPPLDESLVTLKRKAPAHEVPNKKRRTSGDDLAVKPVKSAKKEDARLFKAATQKAKNGKPSSGKQAANGKDKINGTAKLGKPTPKLPAKHDKDDALEDLVSSDEDGIDDPDVIEDDLDGIATEGLEDLEDDEELEEDEFLDSEDDVVDSDVEVRKGMWSEDEEDDDEAEEKLTAANIEGLSRRLDMQQAEEDAEAQAELEEAGMQTNIAGDRPRILDDSDDENAARGPSLLAPDLQFLRTRITDTVRVLEDFTKLAEEGRSRAEYTKQLLKDICAYY